MKNFVLGVSITFNLVVAYVCVMSRSDYWKLMKEYDPERYKRELVERMQARYEREFGSEEE